MRVVLGVSMLIGIAGCSSPESTRMRSGGPGGDVGNRNPVVEMHDGANPYWRTPKRLGEAVGMRELAPSRQAQDLGRSEPAASPRAEKR